MANTKQHKKITCPACGAEMNWHADKLDHSRNLKDPNMVDPDLGGILEEIHTCPRCGKIATRVAERDE